MEDKTKKIMAITSSALMLTTMSVGSAIAEAGTGDSTALAATESNVQDVSKSTSIKVVEGVFSYTQGEITPTSAIKEAFASASKYLCGSGYVDGASEAVSPQDWTIAVHGDVENAYSATLAEMSEKGAAKLTMMCTCAGNPAGGIASADADVLGVSVASIMDEARVFESANTVVFKSSDGYEIALPLRYVKQKFSIIAYDINGEPVANSMGGSNQLWLGATAASYFARDVVEITFETRDTPPPRPGSAEAGDAYANVPNVCITQGEEI